MDFPSDLCRVALMVKIPTAMQKMQKTWVRSWGQEDPLEKETLPTPVSLPGKFHGQRSSVGYSPWGCKESDRTEQVSTWVFHSI